MRLTAEDTTVFTTKLGPNNRRATGKAIITRNVNEPGDKPIILRANAAGDYISPDAVIESSCGVANRLLKVVLECGHSNNETVIELATEWCGLQFPVHINFSRYPTLPEPMNYGLAGTFGLDRLDAYKFIRGVWMPTKNLIGEVRTFFINCPLVSVSKN